MKDLLLGIDVGTYSSKAVLTLPNGQVLRTETVQHGISTPRPGYIEQDAESIWWNDLVLLCRKIFSNSSFSASDVAAVAVSAIGPCLLPLGSHGEPLRPGILYGVDTRAELEIAELNKELGEEVIFQHSKMALTSQAIVPKLMWLKKNEPEIWRRTKSFASASSYLVMKLTGINSLDHHTASHFMPLYDPANFSWSEKYSEQLGIPSKMLPKLGWSDELAGEVTVAAAEATGLALGTPVTVGTVDALSEAISVGVCEPGDLMIMYGSTTFFILVQNSPKPDRTVWTTSGAFAGQYNLAAGMSTTGSLTRWFCDELVRELPLSDAYDQLFSTTLKISPGSEGLLVLPYFSGERTPINDTKAKGVIAGLGLHHTRDHIFKALLEGVALGIRHNLETFSQIGADVKRIVAVGGGATSEIWPQIVSDVCGKPQIVPAITLGASYGNAFLAGCAVGILKHIDIKSWVSIKNTVQPNEKNKALYSSLYLDYINLYGSTQNVIHRLGRQMEHEN